MKSALLIDILAPDPFPVATLLRAAVDAARVRHGYPSDAVVAEAAGLSKHALSRALTQRGRETQPETLRRVLRVAGLEVALVPATVLRSPPMPTPHPVTPSFLASLAPISPDGRGGLLLGSTTLHPRISDSAGSVGDWSIGTGAGITMAAEVLAELQVADANPDGTYAVRDATGAEVNKALVLTEAGACEPSGPVPPAP